MSPLGIGPNMFHISYQGRKVGSNDMVHNYYLEKAKKSAQLQKDKEVNGKPSMIDPARLPNTANGCKPKPRNWQASMSSRVSNKDVHLGEHRKQKPFLKFNELQCPTCKKCLYSANHDECVLEYLSRLNPRASAQNKDAKSHKTTKRYMPVEKSSASKKPERQIPTGHRFSNKKTVPEKTMNPRSCLRWKPTGRIFKTIGLRWVPTGKIFAFSTNKVDSEPAHGSIVDIPHIHACKQTLGLSAGTSFNGQKQQRIDINADALYNEKQGKSQTVQASVQIKPWSSWQMTSVHISSGLTRQLPPSHSNAEDNRTSAVLLMFTVKMEILLEPASNKLLVGELTLRVEKEAITFNLDQTSRYSSNYNDNSVKQIDVIEMACEEYSQEVLGFFDVIVSGNPTPYYDSIISTSSPTLTPFGDSDFLLLEEADAFLALEDGPTSPEVDDSYYVLTLCWQY
ncbi:hypothetical protein Tco_0656725 [Tanacetum coccineum]|uniref:Reverse transcriptase domain-containing protein n=1 Tax=Tanacetum coccineum TaxID=301880 RepID=A0ABQ4X9T0_9ASTR